MEKVAAMTGLSVSQLARYATIGGVVMVMCGIGGTYITCLLGVAYPCFMSFLALESKEEDDDKQWLTYWVVFGLFNIVDQFAGFILSFIPFYYLLKLCFLIWLFHPITKGATTVYDMFIQPNISEYEKHIASMEQMASKAAAQAKSAAGDLKDKAVNMAKGSKAEEGEVKKDE